MTRLLLTVPEAAEALAISRSKLYELLASGAVDSILIGGSRRIPLTLRVYAHVIRTAEAAAADIFAQAVNTPIGAPVAHHSGHGDSAVAGGPVSRPVSKMPLP